MFRSDGARMGWSWSAAVAAAVVALTFGRIAPAEQVAGAAIDIEYWAGSGPNQALLVVDFQATGGESVAFGYRWAGTATGYDMLMAVDAAGELTVATTYWPGLGHFVDNFSYLGWEGDPANYWCYWLGTRTGDTVQWAESWNGPSIRVLTDGGIDGWYNGFTGTPPRVPEPASFAMLGLALTLIRRSGPRRSRFQ